MADVCGKGGVDVVHPVIGIGIAGGTKPVPAVNASSGTPAAVDATRVGKGGTPSALRGADPTGTVAAADCWTETGPFCSKTCEQCQHEGLFFTFWLPQLEQYMISRGFADATDGTLPPSSEAKSRRDARAFGDCCNFEASDFKSSISLLSLEISCSLCSTWCWYMFDTWCN